MPLPLVLAPVANPLRSPWPEPVLAATDDPLLRRFFDRWVELLNRFAFCPSDELDAAKAELRAHRRVLRDLAEVAYELPATSASPAIEEHRVEDRGEASSDPETASLYHRLTALAAQEGLNSHATSVLIAIAMYLASRERPRPTQREIAESTRLSRGLVNRTTQDLCERGLLRKSGKGKALRYCLPSQLT